MKLTTLLRTDVYKVGHEAQYPNNTTKIYSTLVARSGKVYPASVVFGLTYYLKEYLSEGIKPGEAKIFQHYMDAILGKGVVKPESFQALANLGYWPVEIKAIPEGSLVETGNVLVSFESTHPDFPWVGGFLEGLLLKVWNTITVATNSYKLRKIVEVFADATVGSRDHVDYQIHDFGYRGCSSDETAELGGAAHLLSFRGSDTIPAVVLLDQYYNADSSTPANQIGNSVPASEHSVMCAYGRENEIKAFEHMLTMYPTGIVSIVSDTYNFWNVLLNFTDVLFDRIMARDGKVVFRPDSGVPELILLGDPNAEPGSPEFKGAYEILWEKFGGTTNELGYRVLDSHVGIIYGDGIYTERLIRIMVGLMRKGYATVNPFGIGGLLLQQFSRDQLGFAVKANYVEVDGESREIYKDPITDPGKKSVKGLVRVDRDPVTGVYTTHDQVSREEAEKGELQLVFRDGKRFNEPTLAQIRKRLSEAHEVAGFIPTLDELVAIADAPVKRNGYEAPTKPVLTLEMVTAWINGQVANGDADALTDLRHSIDATGVYDNQLSQENLDAVLGIGSGAEGGEPEDVTGSLEIFRNQGPVGAAADSEPANLEIPNAKAAEVKAKGPKKK
jgi:nicotinamide phosphoribosyltransferase